MQPQIRRELVWPKALRLCHWSLALATVVLLLTGWLIVWAPERGERVDEIHFVAAAVLLAALAARLGLLFLGRGVASLKVLLPNRHRLKQGLGVLQSYLTLGRLPLPRWHAHNPLWAPLYLVLFTVLAIQVVTGLLLLQDVTIIGGASVRTLHHWGWLFLLTFSLLHLVAVFFHDAKGTTAEISGMVNGHRFLTLEPVRLDEVTDTKVVPLDALAQQLKAKSKNDSSS